MRLLEQDGHPRLQKHRGVVWGTDTDGNFLIDARRAHDGEYQADGSEPDPANDGSTGNFLMQLPQNSTVTIQINGGATLVLTDQDGNATLTLGDGAVRLAVADHLEALYNQLRTEIQTWSQTFLAHTHLYIFGPTGPASAGTPPGTALNPPAWDSRINSSKVAVPDT
jgi:hypothetical protein